MTEIGIVMTVGRFMNDLLRQFGHNDKCLRTINHII